MLANNILIVMTALTCFYFLFQKKIRQSAIWHATVTPLASIIGSGFLVSAPLLILAAGKWSLLVMLFIILVGYGLGNCIRFNIRYLEPVLRQIEFQRTWIYRIEHLSRLILGLAYIISVAFYLKLLSAFILRGVWQVDPLMEKLLTTALLVVIGVTGKVRGLRALEYYEVYSVNTRLSVIMAIIIGSIYFNYSEYMTGHWNVRAIDHATLLDTARKILGMLIIIQGFETSRYLGAAYPADLRIKTMRYAQMLSGIIYISFIALTFLAFNQIELVDETSVIEACRQISPILVPCIIIAACMSQFSAAVADTVGSGGLLQEITRGKLSLNNNYLIISAFAITLIWVSSIYEVIVFASKGFAVYYFFQLVIAAGLIFSKQVRSPHMVAKALCIILMALMLAVILFGIPVE